MIRTFVILTHPPNIDDEIRGVRKHQYKDLKEDRTRYLAVWYLLLGWGKELDEKKTIEIVRRSLELGY